MNIRHNVRNITVDNTTVTFWTTGSIYREGKDIDLHLQIEPLPGDQDGTAGTLNLKAERENGVARYSASHRLVFSRDDRVKECGIAIVKHILGQSDMDVGKYQLAIHLMVGKKSYDTVMPVEIAILDR